VSDSPYIPFYTSDFLGGTSGLTAATKGVYITLLCMIYEAEAPIGQSWETLARRCGCTLPAFRKAVEALIDDGKLTLRDGRIWSEKCEKHIALRAERRNSARSAAERRWQKTNENQGMADATASSAQCQPEPESDIEKKEKNPPTPQGGLVAVEPSSSEFEKVWPHYPRRVGKAAAHRAWLKARRRAGYDEIAEPLKACIRAWRNTPPDKIPHFATWLNRDGWLDDPGHASNRARTGREDVESLSRITAADDVASLFADIPLRIVK
jgi:uncharacterized protein YdaU (DUF1376 family)